MKELFLILLPHDNWFNDAGEEKNLEAKKALYRFYDELIKIKPEKEYRKNRFHIYYLDFLIKIKKALMEEKYMRACNELVSLMYYQPYLQGRIYYNIIKVLEEELG